MTWRGVLDLALVFTGRNKKIMTIQKEALIAVYDSSHNLIAVVTRVNGSKHNVIYGCVEQNLEEVEKFLKALTEKNETNNT